MKQTSHNIPLFLWLAAAAIWLQACGNLRVTPKTDELRGTEIGNGQELQNDIDDAKETTNNLPKSGSQEPQGPMPSNNETSADEDDDSFEDEQDRSDGVGGAANNVPDDLTSAKSDAVDSIRLPAPYDATFIKLSTVESLKKALLAAVNTTVARTSSLAFADLDGDGHLSKAEVDAAISAINDAAASAIE